MLLSRGQDESINLFDINIVKEVVKQQTSSTSFHKKQNKRLVEKREMITWKCSALSATDNTKEIKIILFLYLSSFDSSKKEYSSKKEKKQIFLIFFS